jgi:disulfide bond formation protein DsbB
MHSKSCMQHIRTLKPCILNLFHRFAAFGLKVA